MKTKQLFFTLRKTQRKSDSTFNYYVFVGTQIPFQGWKIHVSAYYKNYKKIKETVKQFCFKNKINFKIIKNKKIFLESLGRGSSRNFTGKFITIYPQNTPHTKWILSQLFSLLKNFKGPEVLTDKRFKNSILHYRYGNNWKLLQNKFTNNKYTFFEDKREIGKYKPDEIMDLFPNSKPSINLDAIKGYSIKTVIYFSNYGGVYLVQKNENFFILKEGRPYVGVSSSNNAIFCRRREAEITEKINLGFFPKLIETFEINGYWYGVYEWIPGFDLSIWQQKTSITLPWNSGHNQNDSFQILEQIMNLLLSLLKTSKSVNLILNDVKANNFVWNGGKIFKFIDLEFSFFNTQSPIKVYNIFGRLDKYSSWESDVKKVGFLLANLLVGANFFANKFKNQNEYLKVFKEICILQNVKYILYKKIVKLITFGKKNLEQILNLSTKKHQWKFSKIFLIKKFNKQKWNLLKICFLLLYRSYYWKISRKKMLIEN